jgi:hypothetical protein
MFQVNARPEGKGKPQGKMQGLAVQGKGKERHKSPREDRAWLKARPNATKSTSVDKSKGKAEGRKVPKQGIQSPRQVPRLCSWQGPRQCNAKVEGRPKQGKTKTKARPKIWHVPR